MTDRDQVAREVLTEAVLLLAGSWDNAAHIVELYRDGKYPAPAAPVTVTVEGVTYKRDEEGWWIASEVGSMVWIGPRSDSGYMLDRIAADAQRIAELEREVEELRDRDRTADDARGNLLLQTICRLPDVLTAGDWHEWLDAHRHQWLNDDRAFGGWIAERLSAHMTRVERERDEARRMFENAEHARAQLQARLDATSQGKGLGAPASTSDEAPNSLGALRENESFLLAEIKARSKELAAARAEVETLTRNRDGWERRTKELGSVVIRAWALLRDWWQYAQLEERDEPFVDALTRALAADAAHDAYALAEIRRWRDVAGEAARLAQEGTDAT